MQPSIDAIEETLLLEPVQSSAGIRVRERTLERNEHYGSILMEIHQAAKVLGVKATVTIDTLADCTILTIFEKEATHGS